ncbi:saccharopine dehydrogenase family protein [Rhodovibrionaceae bacterium A322]
MMPQCGLAPGFISIAAHDMATGFDEIQDVKLRVGALPLYPSNALKYNMTWSTEGLINEYCRPCEAVVDGNLREVLPLEGLEEFALNGDRYEAFNTSGGLGTLCETLEGRVRNLDYKTIRYPGHQAIMKLLTQDLGLASRQDLLKEVMEAALPATLQDVIVIFVTVSGRVKGRLMQENFARKVLGAEIQGQRFSAIQITTASGICTAMDLVLNGALAGKKGFLRQEEVTLDTFLNNRFGWPYRAPEALPAEEKSALSSAA